MLNSLYFYCIIFIVTSISVSIFALKNTFISIVILELCIIITYLLAVYVASILNDPRIFITALLVIFIASVELVFYILFYTTN